MAEYRKDPQGRRVRQITSLGPGQVVIGGRAYDFTAMTFESAAEPDDTYQSALAAGRVAPITFENLQYDPAAPLEPPA